MFLAVSPAEAEQAFRFDTLTPPQDGSLYVQNPCNINHYILPSEYDVRMAREKVAAFRQLAAQLGAKKLTLVSASLKSKKSGFWGRAKSTLPEAAAQAGLVATFDADESVSHQVYAEYGKPVKPPSIPESLRAWIETDPDFRSMAHDRMEARLERDRVALELKSTSSFDASVVAMMNKIGVAVGGKFESLIHSVWNYEVEYWPVEDEPEEGGVSSIRTKSWDRLC